MSNNKKKYKWFFVNVILFAAYPVLYVFVYNQQYLKLEALLLPILIVEAVAWVVWLGVFVILRNTKRASFITVLSIILFFSHNIPFYSAVRFSFITPHIRDLLILGSYAIFPLIFFLGIYISDKKLKVINNFLNITAIIICLFSIYSIVIYQTKADSNNKSVKNMSLTKNAPDVLPDIYYIIPDAHARADIFNEIYREDESSFINFLENKGFYVAKNSYTNYPQTILSLSSSLNMIYHEGYDRMSRNIGPLVRKLNDATIQNRLEDLGYKTYSFSTGSSAVERKNVDHYLYPRGALNDFHMVLLKMTPLSNISSKLVNFTIYNSHRKRILYTLDTLPKLVQNPGPKFVMAHIVSPHFPFIFNKDGSQVPNEISYMLGTFYDVNDHNNSKKQYIKYYKGQLLFIDSKLKDTIEKMLVNITRPTIIVLQADHGPASYYNYNNLEGSYLKERFAILNAYYFYDKNYDNLYQSISPVNTFRLISNQYLGDNLKLLPDKSYNTLKEFPYMFVDITDQRENKLKE